MIENRRRDFSADQITFCETLDDFAPQIKEVTRYIRRDRKEDMDSSDPMYRHFAELETISSSFIELCGGYWNAIDSFPSFSSFIAYGANYLDEVLIPSINELKNIILPKKGEEGSGMNNSFIHHLEGVENIAKLLKFEFEKAKKLSNSKASFKCFLEENWKIILIFGFIVTSTIAIIGNILVPILKGAGSEENLNKSENSSFVQSPLVAGNVGAINYNSPPPSSYLNRRDRDTQFETAEELVREFFDFYNSNKFQKACSLMKKSKCDESNAESVSKFSREAEKQSNGYEDLQIKELELQERKDEIVCVKYSYSYKTDSNPSKTSEIFSFYVANREDGLNEIVSRVCEKKYDSVLGNRNCPIQAKQKYCMNAFN